MESWSPSCCSPLLGGRATKQPYVALRPPAGCPIQYHHHHNLPRNEYKWECQRKEREQRKKYFKIALFLFISGNIGWLVTMPGNKKRHEIGPKAVGGTGKKKMEKKMNLKRYIQEWIYERKEIEGKLKETNREGQQLSCFYAGIH